jgi:hypothetical protein
LALLLRLLLLVHPLSQAAFLINPPASRLYWPLSPMRLPRRSQLLQHLPQL